MGLRICAPGVFGEFKFPNVMQSYAGDSLCEWGPSRFLDDHVYIGSGARRHVYDRMYPFELGVVPSDIILEGSSFVRDSQVFPLGVDIDGTAKIVSLSLF